MPLNNLTAALGAPQMRTIGGVAPAGVRPPLRQPLLGGKGQPPITGRAPKINQYQTLAPQAGQQRPTLGNAIGRLAANMGSGMVTGAQQAGTAAGRGLARPMQTVQSGIKAAGQLPRTVNRALGQAKPPPELSYNRPIGPNYFGQTGAAMGQQNALQQLSMADAVGKTNSAFWGGGGSVAGPLQGVYSNPVAPGSAHGAGNSPAQAAALGQWQANYTNTPKAQQTLGAYGDVGDARWQQAFGNSGATVDDRGNVIGGGGGAGTGGGAGAGGGAAAAATGDPMDDMANRLIDEHQTAQDAYNAEVDARYNSGLQQLQDLQKRAGREVNRLGAAQSQDIRDNARRADANVMQGMTARGLANTTSLPVLRQGVQREAGKAQVQLGDSIARQRLDSDNQFTQNVTNWMQSNAPTGPDPALLTNLIGALGASGYGQAGQDMGPIQTGNLGELLQMLNGIGGPQFGGGAPGFNVPQYQSQYAGRAPQGYGGQQQGPVQQRLPQMNQPGGAYTRPISQGPGGREFVIDGPGANNVGAIGGGYDNWLSQFGNTMADWGKGFLDTFSANDFASLFGSQPYLPSQSSNPADLQQMLPWIAEMLPAF